MRIGTAWNRWSDERAPLKDLSPTPTATPIRMIHHGAAQPERQLELMIDAVDLLDDRFELDLMLLPTDRAYFSRLKRLVDARSSVRMVDAVSQREIVERCHEYDIGVFLLPARSDNQLYVLPNKLFEFIQARLAIAMVRRRRWHGSSASTSVASSPTTSPTGARGCAPPPQLPRNLALQGWSRSCGR